MSRSFAKWIISSAKQKLETRIKHVHVVSFFFLKVPFEIETRVNVVECIVSGVVCLKFSFIPKAFLFHFVRDIE